MSQLTTIESLCVPTPRQLEFQSWELGLFLHFGIRTFFDGRDDWDTSPMPATAFAPQSLDCRAWIAAAHRAGFRYAVLTAKHHDGFALWPSRHTEYSVASSPWKQGQGDVVREYVDACREHDFGVGIYYSPAQVSVAGQTLAMEQATAYDDYFIAQVSELLDGRYGRIDMLWFDGCGSEDHEYDWTRIVGEIRRMQPEILIFNMADPDYRWTGNEAGLAQKPNWNVTDQLEISVRTDQKVKSDRRWLPVECDLMMRDHSWFYEASDAHTVKSVAELMGIYEYSVGRGANMLLNIGPDRTGQFPQADAERLAEFGEAIEAKFGHPIATFSDPRIDEQTHCWTWTPSEPTLIDGVILSEWLIHGEKIRRFSIEVDTYLHCREPIVVYEGYNVGHKAICTFPPVRARSVIVRVREAAGSAVLRNVAIFKPASA